MQIEIRKVPPFLEVVLLHQCTKIDLGLLDKKERVELARQFEAASDELLSGPEMAEN